MWSCRNFSGVQIKQLGSEATKQLGHPELDSGSISFVKKSIDRFRVKHGMTGFTLAEVFYPAERSKRIAFTLAEVLITLSIIGVVAALTMPTLIQNHRKHVVETRLQKFYSVMNQAIKLSEVDNGECIYWQSLPQGHEEDEDGNPDLTKSKVTPWFNKYLKPYLNVVKVETSKSHEGRVAAYFPDGSVVLISYPTWVYFPNAKEYKEIYSDDAEAFIFARPGGNKCFTFHFVPQWGYRTLLSFSYVYNYSTDVLKNDPVQGCYNKNANSEHAYCSTLIQRNGWKIPDDYPYKF